MKKTFLKLLSDDQLDKLLEVLVNARKELLEKGFTLSELVSDKDFVIMTEMSAKIFKEIRTRYINNR